MCVSIRGHHAQSGDYFCNACLHVLICCLLGSYTSCLSIVPAPILALQIWLVWCRLVPAPSSRQKWSFGAAQPRSRCKVQQNPADAPAAPSAIGTAHQKALLELCRLTTPLSVAGLLLTLATLSAAHQTIMTASSDDPSEGCSISGVPPSARYAHAPREAHAQSAEHAQTA